MLLSVSEDPQEGLSWNHHTAEGGYFHTRAMRRYSQREGVPDTRVWYSRDQNAKTGNTWCCLDSAESRDTGGRCDPQWLNLKKYVTSPKHTSQAVPQHPFACVLERKFCKPSGDLRNCSHLSPIIIRMSWENWLLWYPNLPFLSEALVLILWECWQSHLSKD